MLERLSIGGLATLIAAVAIPAVVAAYLWLAGSVVVVDKTRGVEDAFVVTSSGSEQQLSELWSGYFYAIPRLEGTIQIRCQGGLMKEAGYVTGHMHTKIRIVGDRPCERVEEVI
jgi:hypothetical protein